MLKILFAGTPDVAVPSLRALAADRFGDEKTPPWLFGIERSGMNLHIVDIFQRHAVLHAYGQAVPG